ncbi:MAG TPA: glycosyltransferase [Candidatus Paceibacterota bacterium]|nr:glycosyltransferase [Candidatus Paceibacterota bacterium]
MPKVSVIIPTHNRPNLLPQAIRTVLDQTFQDFEIIVIDDGLVVRADEVVKAFSDHRIRYYQNQVESGGAVTRNNGIAKAQGEFLAFLDDDDEWTKNKLEEQVKALDSCSSEVVAVFTGVEAYDQNGKFLYRRLPNCDGVIEPFVRLLRRPFIWTSAIMYRRAVTEEGIIFDPELKKNQEWDLCLRLSKVGKFFAINEPLTKLNILGEDAHMGGKKNLDNIIHGYNLFLEKHLVDFKKHPKSFSLRLQNLGTFYQNNRQSILATKTWWRSWLKNPFNWVSLKLFILSLPRTFYTLLKESPITGSTIEGLRKVWAQSLFKKWQLRRKDWQMMENLVEIFGKTDPGANGYLSEFKNLPILKREFSYGHAGDFDAAVLYLLVRILKPDIVVETGVASGRSSSFILQGLEDNKKGKLISIDLPKFYKANQPETYLTEEGNTELKSFVPQEREPGWLVPRDLRHRWELVLGDSRVELPKIINNLEKVDLFYHDSDHSYESMMFEYETVWPKLSVGGFLVSDDIKWNKAWFDFVCRYPKGTVFKHRSLGVIKKTEQE